MKNLILNTLVFLTGLFTFAFILLTSIEVLSYITQNEGLSRTLGVMVTYVIGGCYIHLAFKKLYGGNPYLYLERLDNFPWYRRAFPWMPMLLRDKNIRQTTLLLWDTNYYGYSLTKKHGVDLLIPFDRKWWHLPICGFQVWM